MKHITYFAILSLAFIGCTSTGSLEVSITGLETTTYVNGKLTFNIAVTGGNADTLELRRNGELFQVVSGGSFVWDTQSTPEGTYTFVARARSADKIVESSPRLVVVDRTPASLTLNAVPSANPLVLPGSIALTATASDGNGVPKVEFFNSTKKLGESLTAPYAFDLPLEAANNGVYNLIAQVVDRAGNITRTAVQKIPAYVRQTITLNSEAALDGCIDNAYTGIAREYRFTNPSCTFTTSYDLLQFFSFDRSGFPNAVIENAIFRFHDFDVGSFSIKLASVSYSTTATAPPTTQTSPFTSSEPETTLTLAKDGSAVASQQSFNLTDLVSADALAGRTRSQFRFRSGENGPSGLGGTVYFAEAGAALIPTLELKMLVP
jgi:Bacterial Ig domain